MDDAPLMTGDPDENGRRRFLACACGIMAAPLAVVTACPLAAALVGTIYRKPPLQFSKASGFAEAPIGQPVKVSFTHEEVDAYLRSQTSDTAWVIKQGPTAATVFSPICPHMGCRSDWNPAAKAFVCPCHNSVFSISGEVVGGPSPRPLDTLSHKIEDGALYIQWERFATGISDKVRI
jgi:Rieske Fe-S protein